MTGIKFDDYLAGLEHFFIYIQKIRTRKNESAFTDNYSASSLPKQRIGVVEIFDPVNPENNVAADVDELARKKIRGTCRQENAKRIKLCAKIARRKRRLLNVGKN